MNQFLIKPEIEIPYFDHEKSLKSTVLKSARRRGMNPFSFFFKKIRNYILFRIAFFSPLNSVRIKCHRWRGVNIGENVYIGMMCTIDNAYPEYVYIEDEVSIAGECLIIAHSNPYSHFKNIISAKVAPVVIKKGAWICVKSILLPGIEIGVHSIVSAGAVVDSDIPSFSIASGNPARIVAKNIL